MADKEFLLRVRPLPEGGYQATCQAAEDWSDDADPVPMYSVDGPTFDGQGVTALAAMFAALVNSQVDVIETQVSE